MDHLMIVLNVLKGALGVAVWLVKYKREKEEAQAAKEKHAEPLSNEEDGDGQDDFP